MAYCVPLGIPHSRFLSWDPDDQDKALAWNRAKEEICPRCGTREAEWKDNPFAYIGDLRRCPGCELLEMERDNIPAEEHGVEPFLRKPKPDEGFLEE